MARSLRGDGTKVLHVVPGIGRISGGPSFAGVGMIRALARLGTDVWLATTRDRLDRYQPVEHDDIIADRVLFFKRSAHAALAYSLALSRWLSERIASFDVVHVHSYFNFPSHIGAGYARRRSVPYINCRRTAEAPGPLTCDAKKESAHSAVSSQKRS